MDISLIDSNLKIETNLKETDIVWFDVRKEPLSVHGLYNYKNETVFRRIPESVATATSRGVTVLHTNTAGGRVRFRTDSRYIAIKCEMPSVCIMPHMPLLGSSGFDLYAGKAAGSIYSCSFVPPNDMKNGYESIVYPTDGGVLTDYTINFPLYNNVTNLYIGIQSGSKLCESNKYTFEKPVVFYGSSITQGGCASRPGNSYQGFISRRLDTDYINLGFSGSGKAEEAIVEYMSTLDMSIFVSDYDHNAPDVAYLQNTHSSMYRKIREKNPSLPYIMISRPDFDRYRGVSVQRRNVVYSSYIDAVNSGDNNVYYIDGESLFGGENRDACTVDCSHPNDLGFYRMADVIGNMIKQLLKQ